MIGRDPKISWFFAALIACAIGAVPVPARASQYEPQGRIDRFWATVALQNRGTLRERLLERGSRRQQVDVAHYRSQGGPAFILDQSGVRPLLRFDGSSEIWVLRPSAGVRGDIYYRNDLGEVVLRATRLGGLTLYTSQAPGGVPCAPESVAEPLEIAHYDVRSLFRHMLREAARGGLALGGQLEIRARDVDPDTDDIYGDTATVAVDGIVRLSQSRGGRESMAGLRIVSIVEGRGPDVLREGDTLVVTISPSRGPVGRPSSARIMRALS